MRGRGRSLASAGIRLAPMIVLGVGVAAVVWFGFVPVAFAVYDSHRSSAGDPRALIGLSIAANVIVLCALLIGRLANRRDPGAR